MNEKKAKQLRRMKKEINKRAEELRESGQPPHMAAIQALQEVAGASFKGAVEALKIAMARKTQ